MAPPQLNILWLSTCWAEACTDEDSIDVKMFATVSKRALMEHSIGQKK